MKDMRKEAINQLIKRLEQIRDTDEIKEVNVIPFHIVEEFRMVNGEIYGIGSQNIEIRYEKIFVKKDEFDEWKQMK
ncbi:MAG: hypothetical protein IKN65_00685 [Clostridia bacterium]|nr:hypothetical protein [Bacilli bacterium]MBR3672799.1 hypothetical protein [Clostridia bacterium]